VGLKPGLARDPVLGVFGAVLLLSTVFIAGRLWGHKPAIWMCDDTSYTRTAPVGFDVVGPTVRPIPGCGE
jgi:hypothetical protein